MAKREDRPLSRKQLSRHAKEARMHQRLVIGTVAVLALVVLVLGYGLVNQYVLRPRTPVVTVADREVRLDQYQDLVRYRRWDLENYVAFLESQKMQAAASGESGSFMVQYYDSQIQQVQSQLTNVPTQVLEEIIDGEIVRLWATEMGLSVTETEIDQHIEEQFGYERNPPTPTPTPVTATVPITATPMPTIAPMTEEQFVERSEDWFRRMTESTDFTKADFRHLIETLLLREKLVEVIEADVPTTAEQIKARHILVPTKEEAQDVLDRLNAGESFEDLAAELSTDESNKDLGGDLGWFPRGTMVEPFEEAVFALQPGERSGIVETSFGFHIIRVDDRDVARELDVQALEQARSQAVQDWFTAQREVLDIERHWDSSMVPEA